MKRFFKQEFKTPSEIYWEDLIRECKKESRLIRREVLIDELVSWGLVMCVVLLLVIIFIK